jgi:hypothetical protein
MDVVRAFRKKLPAGNRINNSIVNIEHNPLQNETGQPVLLSNFRRTGPGKG